jgi:hypothetical protein
VAQINDDERPPIIVKGGSLIIQSGDAKSSNPKHKFGKKWEKDGKNWKQTHGNGKHVGKYSVSFQGGGATCTPDFASDVRVTYKPKSGDKIVIVITRRERSSADNDTEPLIVSPVELQPDNERDQPTLTLAGEGKILSIAIGSKVCSEPVGAKLQPVK